MDHFEDVFKSIVNQQLCLYRVHVALRELKSLLSSNLISTHQPLLDMNKDSNQRYRRYFINIRDAQHQAQSLWR